MKSVSAFLFLALLICGCDPMRRINISNSGTESATIVWHTSEDSIGFNPFVLQNSSELSFTLHPHQPEIKLSFEMGQWSPEYVAYLMKYLQALDIQSGATKLSLTDPKAITAFLLSHRRKHNTVIVIDAARL